MAAHPPGTQTHAGAMESAPGWNQRLSDAVKLFNHKPASTSGIRPRRMVYGCQPSTRVDRATERNEISRQDTKNGPRTTGQDEAKLMARAASTSEEIGARATRKQEAKSKKNER